MNKNTLLRYPWRVFKIAIVLWITNTVRVTGEYCDDKDPNRRDPYCSDGCCPSDKNDGSMTCCEYLEEEGYNKDSGDNFLTIVFSVLGVVLLLIVIVFGFIFYKCYKSRRQRQMLGGGMYGTPGFSVTYGPDGTETTHLPQQYPGYPANPNAPFIQDGRVQVAGPIPQPAAYPVAPGQTVTQPTSST